MKNLVSTTIAVFLLAALFMPGVVDSQEYEPAITDTGVVRLVDVMDVYKCEDGTTTATCAAISFILCFEHNDKAHCQRIGVPHLADDDGSGRDKKIDKYFRILSLVTHPEPKKIDADNPLQAVYMFIQTGTMKGDGRNESHLGKAVYSDKNFSYTGTSFVFRPSDERLKLEAWYAFFDEGGCYDENIPMCAFYASTTRVFDEIRSRK